MNMNKVLIISLSLIIFDPLTVKSACADSGPLKTASKTSLSMVTATVVGTPIAIVRKTAGEYVHYVKEFKKDSNTYKFWGVAYSVPVAVVSGLIKGTVNGTNNAIRYSINKPFGKDAFSLGNLEESTAAAAKGNPNPEKPESQPWGTPR